MLNLATQRHISHVILIDKEPSSVLRELSRNAEELYEEFCRTFREPRCGCYTLVLAFPRDRADLQSVAEEIQSHMRAVGANCTISSVAEADMTLVKGKAGLLACSTWALAGAVLLNDKPVDPLSAVFLLQAANTDKEIRILDEGFHVALLDRHSIGPSILRLPESHSLGDILKSLSGRSLEGPSKKSWRFWK